VAEEQRGVGAQAQSVGLAVDREPSELDRR